MKKQYITISILSLTTLIFAACTTAEPTLPTPYNDLYTIQNDSAEKLADAGQKLGAMVSSPEQLSNEATTLEQYLSDQKNKITALTLPEAENIKTDTLRELDDTLMLISAIKSNTEKLATSPTNIEDITTILNGYLSRLDAQSAKFKVLKEKLVRQIDPEQASTAEDTTDPRNPRASEATI